MRIQRPVYPDGLGRRRPRRRSGCLSLTVFLGAVVGLLVMSWGWLGQRLLTHPLPIMTQGDLSEAERAFAAGDLGAAITAARRVFDRQPDRADALLLLVRALVYHSYTDWQRETDRQTALDIAAGAINRLSRQPDALAAHALALHANRKSREAYSVAQRALQLDPQHALARVVLALSYGGVGAYESALQEHLRLGEPGQWTVDALRALAISYSDLGRYAEAGQAIDRALALNNRLPLLHFERALYAIQLGDTNRATQSYFQVLALDPDNVKARLRMCELSGMLRETETALSYCQSVTERAPTWADGWHKLGREYYLQGDYAAARDALRRCSSLQTRQNLPITERTFECWYLQGQAAEILGDCPTLVAVYNEFRVMAAAADLPQTWTYPPEGPPGCG